MFQGNTGNSYIKLNPEKKYYRYQFCQQGKQVKSGKLYLDQAYRTAEREKDIIETRWEGTYENKLNKHIDFYLVVRNILSIG